MRAGRLRRVPEATFGRVPVILLQTIGGSVSCLGKAMDMTNSRKRRLKGTLSLMVLAPDDHGEQTARQGRRSEDQRRQAAINYAPVYRASQAGQEGMISSRGVSDNNARPVLQVTKPAGNRSSAYAPVGGDVGDHARSSPAPKS